MNRTTGLRIALASSSVLAFFGCSQGAQSGSQADSNLTARMTEQVADGARQACKFHRGAMPSETLGKELPLDVEIPIQNVVVLMQENRSFDSYFGHLGKFARRTDIESAPENTSNPERIGDPNSPRHPWQHAQMLCISDTNHEWAGSHLEYNNGRMDGFFQANDGFRESGQPQVTRQALSGERALWWYDERDIPFYYDLASTFAIGDHYHSSLLGPTYPNRDFLYAATSRGVTTGKSLDTNGLDFATTDLVIFDELERKGISWTIFVDGFPHVPRVAATLGFFGAMGRWPQSHVETMGSFNDRAKSGTLPAVAFVDANIAEDVNGEDEHPPGDIQTGQKLVSDVVHTLFASPQWKQLALFITYDENGGIYDHVVPPAACPPDDIAPDLTNSEDQAFPGRFDQLGFRVPVMVVSPFTKPGFVSHHVYDHTSITRFIETKFKLPALTNRDANADPMLDFFDFRSPRFATPPRIAEPGIDSGKLEACKQMFAPPNQGGQGGGGG